MSRISELYNVFHFLFSSFSLFSYLFHPFLNVHTCFQVPLHTRTYAQPLPTIFEPYDKPRNTFSTYSQPFSLIFNYFNVFLIIFVVYDTFPAHSKSFKIVFKPFDAFLTCFCSFLIIFTIFFYYFLTVLKLF